jgi:hypothetical protein
VDVAPGQLRKLEASFQKYEFKLKFKISYAGKSNLKAVWK